MSICNEEDLPEINATSELIEQKKKQRRDLDSEISYLEKRYVELVSELDSLREWVWDSDDQNIIDLRRQLLLAAKLAINSKELKKLRDIKIEDMCISSDDEIPF